MATKTYIPQMQAYLDREITALRRETAGQTVHRTHSCINTRGLAPFVSCSPCDARGPTTTRYPLTCTAIYGFQMRDNVSRAS